MIISTDTLLQNIFLASIVLMALSLPKIFIIFCWSSYRLYIFRKLPTIPKKTFVGKSIRRIIPEWIIELHADEEQLMGMTSEEVLRTVTDLKIPMIEALSSILLMSFCTFFLNFDSSAIWFVRILIILLIIAFIMGGYYILKYYSKAKPFLEKHKPSKESKKNNDNK